MQGLSGSQSQHH